MKFAQIKGTSRFAFPDFYPVFRGHLRTHLDTRFPGLKASMVASCIASAKARRAVTWRTPEKIKRPPRQISHVNNGRRKSFFWRSGKGVLYPSQLTYAKNPFHLDWQDKPDFVHDCSCGIFHRWKQKLPAESL